MSEKNHNECIFCQALSRPDGPDSLIIDRNERAFVILNRYPYNNGHVMVVPVAHKSTLEDLDDAAQAELMRLTSRCLTTLREVYHPQGFNIGVNIGEAGGAGVRDHVHMHIVPRWAGDTNFMSAVGSTRVIPESLEDTYSRIQKAWADQPKSG